MANTLIAFFSRADENYFGGAMRYVKVGNTEIVVGLMKELIEADSFKIEMKDPYSPVYMTCIDQAKKDKCRRASMSTTPSCLHIPTTGEQCRWQWSHSWSTLILQARRSCPSARTREAVWDPARGISKNTRRVLI